jgi:hypothetical protein
MIMLKDIEQGTPEWFGCKLAVISASNFNKIVTSKGEKTTGITRQTFLHKVAGEMVSGTIEKSYSNIWMERGIELESEARKVFCIETMTEIEEVGFCYLNEDRTVGCSPDGLNIENNFGIEIKCPKLSTHVKYLIDNKLPTEYVQQVQGSMWVTGYNHWYFMSYCPNIKPLILKVKRDEEYIAKIADAVFTAVEEVKQIIEKIK